MTFNNFWVKIILILKFFVLFLLLILSSVSIYINLAAHPSVPTLVYPQRSPHT